MIRLDDNTMTEELAAAALKAVEAHTHLKRTFPGALGYQEALNTYLQATILYMSIVSLAQAQQYETLSAEVTELRSMIAAAPPALVH